MTQKAIDGLHGLQLGDRNLTVRRAHTGAEGMPGGPPGNHGQGKQAQSMAALSGANLLAMSGFGGGVPPPPPGLPLPGMPAPMMGLPPGLGGLPGMPTIPGMPGLGGQPGPSAILPTRVLVLLNMVTEDELKDDEE